MIACSLSNQTCPHCHNSSYTELWECEDHLVSHERYAIGRCNQCGLLQTLTPPPAEELGHYYDSSDYLSHQTEGQGAMARIYRSVKRYRTGRRVRTARKLCATAPQMMLEVGAGVGAFAHAMQERGCKAYVVEQSKAARELCAQQIPSEQLFATTQEFVAQHSELSGQLDLICLWHSLEHLPDLADQLEMYQQLLKPGGTLCIAVPNAQSFDASYYRALWAAYDVPRHLWHFTPHSMRQTVEAHHFTLKKIRPQRLDVYYIALLSESYKQGGHINLITWLKAFGVGFSYHIRSLFTPMRASALLYHFVRQAR